MKTVCVGIDLGTSNSALALAGSLDEEAAILPIPQLASAKSTASPILLPSALYLPHEGEAIDASGMPWPIEKDAPLVGQWARERGATVPDRLISSAKSWLCHELVDRRAEILPWKSEIAEKKLSPVEAARRVLSHLKSVCENSLASNGEPSPLSDARVVLTVPASFDEVARTLTHEAAQTAGWGRVTLLEEPQAALYAWIAQSGGEWRRQVKTGDLVLVVDVGGGTTDFSLIAVSDEGGDLRLERISVGEHLLLGGDNMDLALGYTLKARLEAEGTKIDHWQLLSLVHACRVAKERLLSDDSIQDLPISIPSRGSSLFAKSISTKLTRAETLKVLDGFLPMTASDALPLPRRTMGMQEYGLPFVPEPAISKHLARFLARSLENAKSDPALSRLVEKTQDVNKATFLKPTAILFNGGVFNAPSLRARVIELVSSWSETPVKELAGAQYDLAVAKGAAYYARTLVDEKGIRIKAGTARSYYLGVQASMPAVPGFEPPVRGVCIVPQGVEEGSELTLAHREFGLVTGEPVEFRFFSSSVRAGDEVGTVVEDAVAELEETARLEITLPRLEGKSEEMVPVRLDAHVTEVGTLELWMKHTQSDQKWNLELNVRSHR